MQASTHAKLIPAPSAVRFNNSSKHVQQHKPFRAVITSAAEKAAPATSTSQYPRWDDIWLELKDTHNLQTLAVEDASALVADGKAVIVDVRLPDDYAQSHIAGSVNVPAFIVIDFSTAQDFAQKMKFIVYKSQGIKYPTDNNPQFLETIKAVAGDKAVIVACEAGGTMTPDASFKTGKVSRSLKAAWRALNSGTLSANQVYHLEGGVFNWYNRGGPMEGEYDPSNAYRTPNAVQK